MDFVDPGVTNVQEEVFSAILDKFRTKEAMEHSALVSEIPFVERMQLHDRLRHAKKRRAQQLKAYTQREKRLQKEASVSGKHSGKRGSDTSGATLVSDNSEKTGQQKLLQFSDGVLMMEAVMRNDISEVTQLLNTGVSPNVIGSDGLTPLHQCCINNAELMFRLLLDAGADVNALDTESWSPLHAAAACGRVSFCEALCARDADVLAINSEGNMPYDLCEDIPSLDVIESEMTKRGVTQQLIDDTRLTPENVMLDGVKTTLANGGDTVGWRGCFGESLLHIAACSGYTRVMQLLINSGASLDARDNDSWQPIHCAAYWAQVPAVELLLNYGVNAKAKTHDDMTILDLCEDVESKYKLSEIIDELAEKKPQKPTKNIGSATPAHRRGRRASLTGGAAVQAWQRRTSVHEKKDPLAMREAKEEALRLQEAIAAAIEEHDDLNSDTAPDDAVNITHNDGSAIFSEADEICDVNSTANTADVVATSSPQETLTTGGSTAPEHITVDDAIAVSPDSDQEKTETPTSPKDVAGPSRSSMFSKRAGVTPSTPPIKESRSKKSHPAVEEHPKHKGCCRIL